MNTIADSGVKFGQADGDCGILLLGPKFDHELSLRWAQLTKTLRSVPSDAVWFAVEVDGYLAAVGAMNTDSGQFGPTFVKPEYRGRGFQKVLLSYRIRHAKAEGLSRVFTHVDPFNIASLRAVLSEGFKPCNFDYEDNSLVLDLELS